MAYSEPQSGRVSVRSLWFGLLAGPVIWTVHFMAIYALAEVACKSQLFDFTLFGFIGVNVFIVAATLLAALLTLYAALVAYRNWRRLGREAPVPARPRVTEERSPFMAFSGVLLSILFTVVIVLTGVPALILRPCG